MDHLNYLNSKMFKTEDLCFLIIENDLKTWIWTFFLLYRIMVLKLTNLTKSHEWKHILTYTIESVIYFQFHPVIFMSIYTYTILLKNAYAK